MSVAVLLWLALLLIVLTASTQWPFQGFFETPVFRHSDEISWAVRFARLCDHPMNAAPVPVAAYNGISNPHTMHSSLPFAIAAKVLQIPRHLTPSFLIPFQLICLWLACSLLVLSMLFFIEIKETKHRFLISAAWGAFLALDPGLAALKPSIFFLLGKSQSAFSVGFDRTVSPSVDIVIFAISLASGLFLLRSAFYPSFNAPKWLVCLVGFAAAYLGLLPPYFPITGALFLTTIFLHTAYLQKQHLQSSRILKQVLIAGIGAIPVIYLIAIKWQLVFQDANLSAMLARNYMLPTHEWSFVFFQKNTTLAVALAISLCALIAAFLHKVNPLSTWPLLWIPLAFTAYNQHVITGKDVQASHFDAPLGFMLGCSMITIALTIFPKRALLIGLVAALSAFVIRIIEVDRVKARFSTWISSPESHVDIRPESIEKAREAASRAGELPSLFVAPKNLCLPFELFSGKTSVNNWLLTVYPVSDAEVYDRWVFQAQLTGESAEDIFPLPKQTTLSLWTYGWPKTLKKPPSWLAGDRSKAYADLLEETRQALKSPVRSLKNVPNEPILVLKSSKTDGKVTLGIFPSPSPIENTNK